MTAADLDRDARVTSITERRARVLSALHQAQRDKFDADKRIARLSQQENTLWRELQIAQATS